MRQFMSNITIPKDEEVAKPKSASECNSCSGGVKDAGENILTVTPNKDDKPTEQDQEQETVVLSGPLGMAVTEALNKKFKKTTAGIKSATEGIDPMRAEFAEYSPKREGESDTISRMRKSVGVVPATDNSYNPVNVMLDAAAKVDEVDFVLVTSVEAPVASSKLVSKSLLHCQGPHEGLEGYAVESVQLVVKVRRTHG